MTASCATAWADALRKSWLQRRPLGRALLSLAWAYGILIRIRKWLYRVHWLRTQRVGVPVIVVGNVVAGGTGKTPVVISLVEHCQARGLRVGVIARGYGRSSSACMEVSRRTDPRLVGDEPYLIHRRTGAPMFVASRRVDAARALLQAHPSTQLIISDDGLQHLALHRDLEIGVFDDRGVGNGWLLPAGPLREPWPRPLDLALHTGVKPKFEGYVVHRTLSNNARRWDGEAWPLAALAALSDRPLLALAAIAQYFPAGTRVARPEGGYFLWVELSAGVNALVLHRQALERGISLAPGQIFSADQRFANCVRINYGHPARAGLEDALRVVGELARGLEQARK